jgi:hypothetical protein
MNVVYVVHEYSVLQNAIEKKSAYQGAQIVVPLVTNLPQVILRKDRVELLRHHSLFFGLQLELFLLVAFS